jgi:hypothetical protein
MRTVLTQLAHTAARPKGTYLSALSHRLATRRGRKEAMVAVAHAKVTSIFRIDVAGILLDTFNIYYEA